MCFLIALGLLLFLLLGGCGLAIFLDKFLFSRKDVDDALWKWNDDIGISRSPEIMKAEQEYREFVKRVKPNSRKG